MRILFSLLLLPLPLLAAPHIVSDSTAVSGITHCAWYLDSQARALVAAPKDSTGRPYCSLNIEGVSVGAHTVTAAFVRVNDVWGEEEGPKSNPFSFTRPAAVTGSPSSLRLTP